MADTTTKGLPFPEDGIDYLIDMAEHVQALAEAVDTKLDDYRLVDIGGLIYAVKTLEADTPPIGTVETAVLTSDAFELTEPTRVEISFTFDALIADLEATAQFRVRPGNLGGTPVGGQRINLVSAKPQGGSFSCYPVLPAGPYTILVTLQLTASEAVLAASSTAPASLLVRPLP